MSLTFQNIILDKTCRKMPQETYFHPCHQTYFHHKLKNSLNSITNDKLKTRSQSIIALKSALLAFWGRKRFGWECHETEYYTLAASGTKDTFWEKRLKDCAALIVCRYNRPLTWRPIIWTVSNAGFWDSNKGAHGSGGCCITHGPPNFRQHGSECCGLVLSLSISSCAWIIKTRAPM
jgi:hypothetical protein